MKKTNKTKTFDLIFDVENLTWAPDPLLTLDVIADTTVHTLYLNLGLRTQVHKLQTKKFCCKIFSKCIITVYDKLLFG